MSSRYPLRPTNPPQQNQHLVASGPSIDGSLLIEVSRVQHDKTLQAVRDLVDRIAITERSDRSYTSKDRTAQQFRADVLAGLQRLRDEAGRTT